MKVPTEGSVSLNRRIRRGVGVLFLALFVALQVFASSALLHKWLHNDADSGDHHCAITLLTHGLVESALAWVAAVIFATSLLFSLPSFEAPQFASMDYRLSPSRAPPVG